MTTRFPSFILQQAGAIFDIPVAYIEILLNLNDKSNLLLKTFLSYLIFLIGSSFFQSIRITYNNFYLSFLD